MLTRYLEHRIRKQYKKLSLARIKNLFLEVQISFLVSKEKRIKYALLSNMKIDTQRIYDLMGVSRK